jgi:hypothetical protein
MWKFDESLHLNSWIRITNVEFQEQGSNAKTAARPADIE